MTNPSSDYIQDLYWMYVSLGYPQDSGVALAEEQLEKETAIYESMDDEGTM